MAEKTQSSEIVKKTGKQDLGKILGQWRQAFTVFAPSREGGTTRMAALETEDAGFLDWYRNTVVPAKNRFLPNLEELFTFQKEGNRYRVGLPDMKPQKSLVFGIRPCDARAVAMLDQVFSDGYEDPYYVPRRKNTLLVGLVCTNPCESCFCTSVGSSPSDSDNVDVMFTDMGGEFLIEGVTEGGKKLVEGTAHLQDAIAADRASAQTVKEESARRIRRTLDISGVEQKLMGSFDDKEHWEKVAAKCITCGICTLLCPTCWCFDINDDTVRTRGTRFRCWDSCAFPLYTKMPMENPREEKWRRVRQKVCHKYEFHPKNYGIIACVGCGRCIRLCPVNWDITQTIEGLPSKT